MADEVVKEQEEVQYDPFAGVDLSIFESPEIAEATEVKEDTEIEEKIETPVDDTDAGVIEKQEEQEEDTGDSPSSQETKDSSPFTPFAKLLVEEGATPNLNLEEFDGTPEGLVKAVQNEIEYNINMYKEGLNPKVKWLQENLEEGVALEQLLSIDKQRVALDAINEETLNSDESLQKQIVREYLKESTKFSDALIDKQIERLEATNDLAEEAKTSFTELKTLNAAKEQEAKATAQQQREAYQKQQQEILDNFKSSLDKTEEIIPGLKLNQSVRDQIFKTLTTPVTKDPTTGAPMNAIAKARLEDPINFEKNLAYVWLVTKGFKDFSTLSSSGKKTAMKELEDALNKGNYTSSKQTVKSPDSSYVKELKESIEMFSKGQF